MLIHEDYDLVTNEDSFSDDEYLLNHLWLLKHIFYNEIAAIVNTKLEYLGISNQFAEIFNCSSEILGRKFSIYNDSALALKIEESESKIIQKKTFHESVYQIKQGNEIRLYYIRKRPIINPVTNNCVGIFISAALLNLAQHSNVIHRVMSGRQEKVDVVFKEELSEEQHQIIACLLMGFHQRKEIAYILQNLTSKEYSDRQIKYFLTKLYQKYNCSSITELIELIINSSENDLRLPALNIPDMINSI